MGLGSYARFFVGLLLSAEIIREWLTGTEFTGQLLGLAVLFTILTLWLILELAGVVPRV